jgi:FkbM family methyltransferase
MNSRLQYELRGWAYWAKCLNPLRNTITIRNLPMGLRLQAYKRDAVGRGLYRRKIHEPALTGYLLKRFLNSGPHNFIDVGANIGYFTGPMSKLAGAGGKVLAIEPEPQNLKLLRENVARNDLANVEVFSEGLGAEEGSAMLGIYKPSNRGRHSMVDTSGKPAIAVPVRTLDHLVRESAPAVSTWSLLKIDVEGYEGFVLEGAQETLPRIETLVLEFSPSLLRKTAKDPAAILAMLCSQFSRLYRIEGAELSPVTVEACLASETQVELVLER